MHQAMRAGMRPGAVQQIKQIGNLDRQDLGTEFIVAQTEVEAQQLHVVEAQVLDKFAAECGEPFGVPHD